MDTENSSTEQGRQLAIADSMEKAAAMYRAGLIPAPRFSALDSCICLDSVAEVHAFAAAHGVEVELRDDLAGRVHHVARLDLGSFSLRAFHIVPAETEVPA